MSARENEAHFDLAAAGLRADGADLQAGLEVLARKLELSLPEATRVHRRRRSLLSSERRVTGIDVNLSRSLLVLRLKRGSPFAMKTDLVHDMRRKTQQLSLVEWLRAIEDELRAAAADSREAREALDRLLDA